MQEKLENNFLATEKAEERKNLLEVHIILLLECANPRNNFDAEPDPKIGSGE